VDYLKLKLVILAASLLPSSLPAAAPELPAVAGHIAAHEEEFWHACEQGAPSVTSRGLFAYAFALCEARQHPERLERLFALAEQMQDRNPQSRTYGNFWWSLRDGKVMDQNAVDFSMRGGALLWLRHREFIPANARARLEHLLAFSVQGCLRHKVQPSYSNIAIMNAGDLILLGEALNQPAVADQGYARFDGVYRYTQASGIHEFVSPTYYGTDLEGLGLIEAYGRRERGRAQARALLELFWTDIAENWFLPAQKLAGAQSRTYDYLRGLGELDVQLALNGWLEQPAPTAVDTVFAMQANWHPPRTHQQLPTHYPRLVRESWGPEWWHARTHYVLPDITLSCAASSYGGRMDMPLTVDLPGDRQSVRGYFIADGREDPYGKKKVAAGAHEKAFHLNPFWAAAQQKADALGLVIYRGHDLPADTTTLVSDFVMPAENVSLWIDARRVEFSGSNTGRLKIEPGEVISLRRGTAALGLRVAWSRGLDGNSAPVFLTHDGNQFGAARLAVEHVGAGEKPELKGISPGAAFWLRVGSGLKTDTDFFRWRQQFAEAAVQVTASHDRIELKASGTDGPVSLAASAPWSAPDLLDPKPTRAVLEVNGHDIGREILSSVAAR
jgi:hypothetical protein